LARVQLVECALQFFELLPGLAELALRSETLVVGKVFGGLRYERVTICCGRGRSGRCRLMVLVYYGLSKDEERRMLGQYQQTYSESMKQTGMFMPKSLEGSIGFTNAGGKVAVFVVIVICAIGGHFSCGTTL
jgi:hypothetical protein